MSESVVMAAKFSGRCLACGGFTAKGKPIVYVPTVGAFHPRCVPERYEHSRLPAHPAARDKLHDARAQDREPRRTDRYHDSARRDNDRRSNKQTPSP